MLRKSPEISRFGRWFRVSFFTREFAAVAGLFLLGLFLRLYAYRTAYDVFLDESIYARIAGNIARGDGVTFDGLPFYLHPPLLFYLDAGWLHLTGDVGADPVHLVWAARILNCIFGAVNVVLVRTLVRRLASSRVAFLAGLAYALDPFVVRFDGRVFLETLTTVWLLAGLLVLVRLAGAQGPAGGRRAAAGGVLLGLAALSKEPSIILFAGPLLFCVLRNRPLNRRHAGIALAAAAVTWVPYPILATAIDGRQWFDQQTRGVRRLLGLVQDSGFNQPHAPSFTGRLRAQLPYFGPTYAIIGLEIFACILVLWSRSAGGRHALRRRRGPDRRPAPQQFLALWGLSAFALAAYQIGLGTLEEQMFYFLAVPAIVNVAIAIGGDRFRWIKPRQRTYAVAGTFVLVFTYLVLSAGIWIKVRTSNDAEVAKAVAWLDANVPSGSRMWVLADGMQIILPQYSVTTDDSGLSTLTGGWVITSSLQAEQGYGFATPSDMRILETRSRSVFTAKGRSMGELVIWQLPAN